MKKILSTFQLKRTIEILITSILTCFLSPVSYAATVHTSDFFIGTKFNGFEGITVSPIDGSVAYVEDGISVQQINGDLGNDIQTTFPAEGSRGWYPISGDYGYTEIRMSDGSDFFNVGFLAATGYTAPGTYSLLYELRNDGAPVQSGSIAGLGRGGTGFEGFSYFGFGGGGFDTIRIADNTFGRTSVGQTSLLQALAIDSIEASLVPIPGALWLFSSGFLGLIGIARRKKAF